MSRSMAGDENAFPGDRSGIDSEVSSTEARDFASPTRVQRRLDPIEISLGICTLSAAVFADISPETPAKTRSFRDKQLAYGSSSPSPGYSMKLPRIHGGQWWFLVIHEDNQILR